MTTETFYIYIKSYFKQSPEKGFIGFQNVVLTLDQTFSKVILCLIFSTGFKNRLILAFFLHG